jgi:Na+/H+ antiporter NhaD/arsenite permease-like protein
LLTAIAIFTVTYLVLAVGRLPGVRVDRTGMSIIGATLMIACNVLPIQDAYAAIDYSTIILLFGMMIVVANLRLSGFFAAVSAWVVEHAHRPILLLSAIVLVSGFFSAFFVNDTMCLVLTPLVLEITRVLRRNPVPYLLAVAMAANIGSVATITGNPQNMMIGSFSGIGYREFSAALAPVAAAGLVVLIALLALIYRREFRQEPAIAAERHPMQVDRVLLWKSLLASTGMVALFFAGWPVSKVALVAGALLLVTRRRGPETIYREIDWSLLVMFIGLFIVVAGVERTALSSELSTFAARFHLQRTPALSASAAVLSNIVSNVPAVLGVQAARDAPAGPPPRLAGAGHVIDLGG